jgi:aryl-alcohol dehydrogenase-like predicted oxidoreductase
MTTNRPAFALGLAALGRPAYINLGHGPDLPLRSVEDLRARTAEVLDAAWAAGIRAVDAARSYGRSEEFLSHWLGARRIDPSAIRVSSKWGYRYVGNWRLDAPVHEVKDHSLTALREQLVESRALLSPFLRLYQIHSATPDSGVLDDLSVLDELARIRDSGLLVGLSASGPSQPDTIRRAIELERGGARLFGSVQATWNLLERSAESALAEAHQAGISVMLKEVLANGRLTMRGPAPHPLAQVASELGATPDAVAIAAALAQPWADYVLLGVTTVDQLTSNLRARNVGALDWSRLDGLRVESTTYWSSRSKLPWN